MSPPLPSPMFRPNKNRLELEKKRRTSVCRSGVRNLGNNPRVFGASEGFDDGVSAEMPSHRSARNYIPSHAMVLETLLRCLPMSMPNGEGREAVKSRFQDAKSVGKGACIGEPHLCGTPLRWISDALPDEYSVSPVLSLDDMMGGQGMMAGTGDFFLMDVILNRELVRSVDAKPRHPDDVVMASAKWDKANLEPEFDFVYRALIAYLPGAGVFYCARERRPGAVGSPNTPVHHDVSWLRISEDVSVPSTSNRFSFGTDGFVRRFYDTSTTGVSAWRVSCGTDRGVPRFVFMAKQCSDSDGPRMPPDTVKNVNISEKSVAERRDEYNSHLAESKAAKIGGRHHVHGSLHLTIPDDCLVINGNDSCPHMDIVIDIAPREGFRARKSVVRVRNLLSTSMDANFVGRSGEPLLNHELRTMVLHNAILRKRCRVQGVRGSQGDVGTMHALGMRVLLDGINSTSYVATHKVPRQLAEAYVKALSRVGQIVFPDVLAVIQDTEGDTGFKFFGPMAGDEAGNRVGGSVDTSSGLANSSHYDTGDATPGFSPFLEEVPGKASNWYFILPNVYGTLPDGSGSFNGIAIKLRHGTAISWDGRLIRHCTSVARPDGPKGSLAGSGGKQTNHLYGTFTAAKEKIVEAGRKRAAKMLYGGNFDFHTEHCDEERESAPDCDWSPLPTGPTPIGVRVPRMQPAPKPIGVRVPRVQPSPKPIGVRVPKPIGVRVPRVQPSPKPIGVRVPRVQPSPKPIAAPASTKVDAPADLLDNYVIPKKKRRL